MHSKHKSYCFFFHPIEMVLVICTFPAPFISASTMFWIQPRAYFSFYGVGDVSPREAGQKSGTGLMKTEGSGPGQFSSAGVGGFLYPAEIWGNQTSFRKMTSEELWC